MRSSSPTAATTGEFTAPHSSRSYAAGLQRESTDLLSELRAAALVDPAYQAVLTSGDLGSLIQREGLLYDGDRVSCPMIRGFEPDC